MLHISITITPFFLFCNWTKITQKFLLIIANTSPLQNRKQTRM